MSSNDLAANDARPCLHRIAPAPTLAGGVGHSIVEILDLERAPTEPFERAQVAVRLVNTTIVTHIEPIDLDSADDILAESESGVCGVKPSVKGDIVDARHGVEQSGHILPLCVVRGAVAQQLVDFSKKDGVLHPVDRVVDDIDLGGPTEGVEGDGFDQTRADPVVQEFVGLVGIVLGGHHDQGHFFHRSFLEHFTNVVCLVLCIIRTAVVVNRVAAIARPGNDKGVTRRVVQGASVQGRLGH